MRSALAGEDELALSQLAAALAGAREMDTLEVLGECARHLCQLLQHGKQRLAGQVIRQIELKLAEDGAAFLHLLRIAARAHRKTLPGGEARSKGQRVRKKSIAM